MTDTVEGLIEESLLALDALGTLGEEIDDEWMFVTDLVDAQRERLAAIAGRRAGEEVETERATAIELAIDETALITDPHRAIDWLSTFPDLVALALDEPVGG